MDSLALRKAAILVGSLDRQAADALLDALPVDAAAAIRQLCGTLHDVPSSEETTVLQDFFGSAPHQAGDHFDWHEFERDALPMVRDTPASQSADEQPGWAVMDDVSLAAYLQHERDTTIAVILNQLPHVRASHILDLLSVAKQPRIVRAMTQVTPIDATIIDEINRELMSWCRQPMGVPRNESNSLEHTRIVLDGVEGRSRDHILSELASSDSVLAKRLGWQEFAATATSQRSPTGDAE